MVPSRSRSGVGSDVEVHRSIPAPAAAVCNRDPGVRGSGRPAAGARSFDGKAPAACFRSHVLTGRLQVESTAHPFLHELQDLPSHGYGAAARFGIGIRRYDVVDASITLTARGCPRRNPGDVGRDGPGAFATGRDRHTSAPAGSAHRRHRVQDGNRTSIERRPCRGR